MQTLIYALAKSRATKNTKLPLVLAQMWKLLLFGIGRMPATEMKRSVIEVARRLKTSQDVSRPLRTFVLGGFCIYSERELW